MKLDNFYGFNNKGLEPTEKEYQYFAENEDFLKGVDKIVLSVSQLEKLCLPLETTDEKASELLANPSLKEFKLVITSDDSSSSNSIYYRTSILSGKKYTQKQETLTIEYVPYIDSYLMGTEATDPITIETLCAFEARDASTGKKVKGTVNDVHMYDKQKLTSCGIDDKSQDFVEWTREAKLFYLAIQLAFKNKPEMFVTRTFERKAVHSQKVNGKYQKINTVKVVKRVYIDDEKLTNYMHEVVHKNCPCWGVMGHFRSYKSGLKIWIAPYKKGKERSNPNAYKPKNYSVEV